MERYIDADLFKAELNMGHCTGEITGTSDVEKLLDLQPAADVQEVINHLQAENAALKARLDKAVELPCAVGDTIFLLIDGWYKTLIVESFHYRQGGFWKLSAHTNKSSNRWESYEIDFRSFGVEVVKTESEAQAKLKEVEDGAL